MRGHPIVLRRMADEPTPAAANVEKALARRESQLAADHLELRSLGFVERALRPLPIGTGIGHGRPEKERVEGIGEVVVELDERLVVTTALDLLGDLSCIVVLFALSGA